MIRGCAFNRTCALKRTNTVYTANLHYLVVGFAKINKVTLSSGNNLVLELFLFCMLSALTKSVEFMIIMWILVFLSAQYIAERVLP